MIAKYQHYNPNENNREILSIIEKVLTKITVLELKATNSKSKYVSRLIKQEFEESEVKTNVCAEKKFLENNSDKIDIEIIYNEVIIIIEIDNLRADQVAKKVLSRTSSHSNQNLIYITYCYDSESAKGHKDECLKYINVHFKNYFEKLNKIEYLAFVPKKYF